MAEVRANWWRGSVVAVWSVWRNKWPARWEQRSIWIHNTLRIYSIYISIYIYWTLIELRLSAPWSWVARDPLGKSVWRYPRHRRMEESSSVFTGSKTQTYGGIHKCFHVIHDSEVWRNPLVFSRDPRRRRMEESTTVFTGSKTQTYGGIP